MNSVILSAVIINNDYNSNIEDIVSKLELNSFHNVNLYIVSPFSLEKKKIAKLDNLHIITHNYEGVFDGLSYALSQIKETNPNTTHILYIDEHTRFTKNPLNVLLPAIEISNDKYLIFTCCCGDEVKYGKYVYNLNANPLDYRNALTFSNIDNKIEATNDYQPFNNMFFALDFEVACNAPLLKYLYTFVGANNSAMFGIKHVWFMEGIYLDNIPYELRMNQSDLYYFYRNKLIIENAYENIENVINKYLDLIKEDINVYLSFCRYNDVKTILYALQDYARGGDFLSSIRPEYLDMSMQRFNYYLLSSNELDTFFTWKEWEKTRNPISEEHKKQNIESHGYIDEHASDFSVIDMFNQIPFSTYNTKKILCWDIQKEVGYVVKRDEKQINLCLSLIEKIYREVSTTETHYDLQFDSNDKSDYGHIFEESVDRYNESIEIRENAKKCYEKVKIIQNQVLFFVGTRLGFCCNPKYILLDLLNHKRKCKIIWVAHKPELCNDIKDKNLEIIPLKDHELVLEKLYSSKVIVYNDSLPFDFVPNKKQVLFNTWHGGINYKKIGVTTDSFMSEYEKKDFMLSNPEPRYYIAGSEAFLKDTSKSFNYHEKIFLKYGLPRNDILLNNKIDKDQIKKKLGIETGKKVCLYAPTFRNNNVASIHNLDLDRLKAALAKRYGGEWLIVYRGHPFTVNFWQKQSFIDVCNYPDQQEVLLISDVVISDYSSIMWDAMLLNVPIFSYSPDYYDYLKCERGFTECMNRAPFSIALNNDEMEQNILNYDHDSFINECLKNKQLEGSFDNGKAAQRAAKLVLKHLWWWLR